MHCCAVIRLNDLDGGRIFYRDVLRLGEPVVDSGFTVIFALSPESELMLEKSEAPFWRHFDGAESWGFGTDDVEALAARLVDNGYPALEPVPFHGVTGVWRGLDPEGNPFFVRNGKRQ